MKTIWKFRLDVIHPRNTLHLPEGFKVLHLDRQDDEPCLWINLDTEAPYETVEFVWYATGAVAPEETSASYVGTVVLESYDLVLHLYRRIK